MEGIKTKKRGCLKSLAGIKKIPDTKVSGIFVCSLKIIILGCNKNNMGNIQFKQLPLSAPSLFPEDIFEKISVNHPVRLVSEVVDQLNIDAVIKQYKGGGTTSYHPRMMIKILFYAYTNNIYSCRKIEKALQENIHFMW